MKNQQTEFVPPGVRDNEIICSKRSQVLEVMRRYGPLVNFTVGGLLVDRAPESIRQQVRKKQLLLIVVGKGSYVPVRQLRKVYRRINRKRRQPCDIGNRWDEFEALDL